MPLKGHLSIKCHTKNIKVYRLFQDCSSQSYWGDMGRIVYDMETKGKVVYGQEPPSGDHRMWVTTECGYHIPLPQNGTHILVVVPHTTTTECGFNYQLLAVITEVAQLGAPSCSQPQPATDNGVRDGRSNWLVAQPHPTQGSTPWAPRIAHCNAGCKSTDLLHWVSRERATSECQTNALPVRPLRVSLS